MSDNQDPQRPTQRPDGDGFARPSTVPGGPGESDNPTRENQAIRDDQTQQHHLGDRQAERSSDGATSEGWREPHGWREPDVDGTDEKGKGLWRWLAVASVAALIGGLVGGGVGAAVVDGDTPIRADQTSTRSSDNREATPNNIRGVLEQVQSSVVTISANGAGGQGSGTGMVVSTDGEILTNNHVVAGASQIKVTFSDDTQPRDARLLGTDSTIDTALLKVVDPPANLRTVKFGDSDKTQVGDEVVAIGNALALTGGPSVTSGIVSAKDRSIADGSTSLENLIQTDTAINPGNSGGPLVNMNGEVIGMNTAVIRGSGGEFENIGFAIAINSVQPAIQDLRKGVNTQPAFLGLTSVTLNSDIKERYELTPDKGAVVSQVVSGTPADRAGLTRFDVITEIDGEQITDSEGLVQAVRRKKPDDEIKIVFYRGDERREVNAKLVARPSSES